MSEDLFDISNIRDPSDITIEVIEKLSAKDAIYLREKFGDQLNSCLVLQEIAEKFTPQDKERINDIINDKKR